MGRSRRHDAPQRRRRVIRFRRASGKRFGPGLVVRGRGRLRLSEAGAGTIEPRPLPVTTVGPVATVAAAPVAAAPVTTVAAVAPIAAVAAAPVAAVAAAPVAAAKRHQPTPSTRFPNNVARNSPTDPSSFECTSLVFQGKK